MKVGEYEVRVEARVVDGCRVELALVGDYTAIALLVLGISEVAVAAGKVATRGDEGPELIAELANEMLAAMPEDPPAGEN